MSRLVQTTSTSTLHVTWPAAARDLCYDSVQFMRKGRIECCWVIKPPVPHHDGTVRAPRRICRLPVVDGVYQP